MQSRSMSAYAVSSVAVAPCSLSLNDASQPVSLPPFPLLLSAPPPLPQPCRCTNLVSLQLVNIYLENNTLQVIAASCPLLQRLTLTGATAAAQHDIAQHCNASHQQASTAHHSPVQGSCTVICDTSQDHRSHLHVLLCVPHCQHLLERP
jgi:hypothetical protein